MRIDKSKIINGIVSYTEKEIIPKLSDDKAMQIILSIGVNAIRRNSELTNKIFNNETIKTIWQYDESDSTYCLDSIFESAIDSVNRYGYLPVKIPAISFISPTEKEMKFNSKDIEILKSYIEGVAV